MTVKIPAALRDERLLSRAMTAVVAAYAVVSLWAQLALDVSPWRADAPVEYFTDGMVLCGSLFAAIQLFRHRASRLRRAWLSAILAMALIAFGESADWFSRGGEIPALALQYKVPLWIVSVAALYHCARHYIAQRRVRSWLLTGLTLQVVSNLIEILTGLAPSAMFGQDEAVELAIDYSELLSLVCYVAALAFTQVAPAAARALAGRILGIPQAALAEAMAWSPRAARPVEVGAHARTLFVERHMFRKPRYPTPYRLLHLPGLRQMVTLAMIVLFGPGIAPGVRANGGKPVGRQFVDLLRMGIGQGIDSFTYYLLELYRPGGEAEARFYLTRYETKNGLFTILNRQRRRPGVPHEMTDKAEFAATCAAHGIPTPPVLLDASDGVVELPAGRDALDRDLFVKLRRGRGTKKTQRYRRTAPWRYVDRSGRSVSLDDIVERLRAQSQAGAAGRAAALIAQPHVANHPALADLAGESLIAIRIVTCLDERGHPEVTHAVLRVLGKIEPGWDTRPDTEYGAAIDLRSGRLGWMTGDRPETCLTWYAAHPITGAPVLGRAVPHWPALQDLALRAHRVFAGRVVVGWDMALSPDGPLVLEGNANMDVSFIQRAYREPVGRSRLGELLDFHLTSWRDGGDQAGDRKAR